MDADFVVVGGGIAGLTAAHAARRAGRSVVVLESSSRWGGKIRTDEVLGTPVDAGPDAFLARRPEAVALCKELGLEGELVTPATGKAYVWTRGRLHPIPEGLVLGVPARFRPLLRSSVLSPAGRARAVLDAVFPMRHRDGDRSIGELVASRFGAEVDARLVDPLLGGINAGRTDRLSVDASAPQLATAARGGRSLARALRAVAPAAPSPDAPPPPVFYSLRTGTERLVARLEETLAGDGVTLRTGAEVTALERAGDGWLLRTADGDNVSARFVVLTTPAFASAALLRAHSPRAATDLDSIEYASVVVVTLVFDAGAASFPDGSGFLVPRVDGRLLSACTWFSAKWPHVRPGGGTVVRLSAGKVGIERAMHLDDETLVHTLRAELTEATGVGAEPVAVRVNRWPRSFPQYDVGHLELVARTEREADALGGISLAGAAYRGVGIPACIGSAERAVERLLEQDQ